MTTELLGKAKIPGLPYENPDGSPLKIDTDYFGKTKRRSEPDARTVRESRRGAGGAQGAVAIV